MKQVVYLFLISIAFSFFACSEKSSNNTDELTDENPSREYYSLKEPYRPQFHFTPVKNWINDPNGLVYYDGQYHLFYQHNPYGNKWGHMSWGHAVSEDLLHWKHLPIALYEEDSVAIFSGSAIVDRGNIHKICPEGTADCMIAFYTSNKDKVFQNQSIAYSSDEGLSWTKYRDNPILDIDRKDFRDPKVFWYEPEQKWIMAVNVPDVYKVQFYSSQDLKEWLYMSDFGQVGDVSRVWECPDLFELPVKGTDESRWVLIISSGHHSGDEFVGMQYFIGDFDGEKFTVEEDEYPLWLDYGKDFYAAVTYNDTEDRILVGWVNNWTYANDLPTSPWNGMMALPRKLSLVKNDDGKIRLLQKPIVVESVPAYGFSTFKVDQHGVQGDVVATEGTILEEYRSKAFIMEFVLEISENQEFRLEMLKNKEEHTDLIISGSGTASINRMNSGKTDFQDRFASVESGPVDTSKPIKVKIIVDHSVVEVFFNDGEMAITDLVFPGPDSNRFRWTVNQEEATIKQLKVKDLSDFEAFYN